VELTQLGKLVVFMAVAGAVLGLTLVRVVRRQTPVVEAEEQLQAALALLAQTAARVLSGFWKVFKIA
jgi:hypothetical protein